VFGALSLISGLATVVFGVGVPNVLGGIFLIICGILTLIAVRDGKPGLLLPTLILLVCLIFNIIINLILS
jgi:hypothetical protein